jgi:hypothetical protein
MRQEVESRWVLLPLLIADPVNNTYAPHIATTFDPIALDTIVFFNNPELSSHAKSLACTHHQSHRLARACGVTRTGCHFTLSASCLSKYELQNSPSFSDTNSMGTSVVTVSVGLEPDHAQFTVHK